MIYQHNIKNVKLLILSYTLFFCYLLSLMYKYSPQHLFPNTFNVCSYIRLREPAIFICYIVQYLYCLPSRLNMLENTRSYLKNKHVNEGTPLKNSNLYRLPTFRYA
jgi:hypothetical protein